MRVTLVLLASAAAVLAEYRPLTEPVPKRDRPPVLFLTGHDSICPTERSAELPFSEQNFGVFDQVMERVGRVSLHFNVCSAPGRPPIEEIANLLRAQLAALQYDDGTPVTDIDVLAHSMGGLVLRSYLSGKQVADGLFDPPSDVPFRKLVFLGTPHFGTSVAFEYETDPQLREMALGSQFLFDLARWNGGREDLRGLEAIAILGTAGINTIFPGFIDSVVTLSSGSLDFVQPGRTRILPGCHTARGLGALLLCESGAIGIARVEDDAHPTVRVVLSFFDGTAEWQTIGNAPEGDVNLSAVAAVIVQARDASDRPIALPVVPAGMRVSAPGLAFADRAAGAVSTGQDQFPLTPGVAAAQVTKPGPVVQSARMVDGVGVLEGVRLEQPSIEFLLADGTALPVEVLDWSSNRVRFAPPAARGMVKVRVTTPAGVFSLSWLYLFRAPGGLTGEETYQ